MTVTELWETLTRLGAQGHGHAEVVLDDPGQLLFKPVTSVETVNSGPDGRVEVLLR
jgi:hypothetical protein